MVKINNNLEKIEQIKEKLTHNKMKIELDNDLRLNRRAKLFEPTVRDLYKIINHNKYNDLIEPKNRDQEFFDLISKSTLTLVSVKTEKNVATLNSIHKNFQEFVVKYPDYSDYNVIYVDLFERKKSAVKNNPNSAVPLNKIELIDNFTSYIIEKLKEELDITLIDKVLSYLENNVIEYEEENKISTALEKISESELQKSSEVPEAFEDRIESVSDFLDKTKTKTKINEFLVFGTLSIVRVEPNEVTKKEILNNWIQTEVVSKIVKNGGLNESRVLLDLLKYLSNNVGNFISISKVADNLSISEREVFNLLENLQEIYIIYRLPLIFENGNLNRKLCRYYFYDLGVRNCIISDFSTFNLRTNNWQLWENFIISERIKNLKIKALGLGRETFFWDSISYENIEWIEKVNGKLNCYQISFNVDEVSTLKYFREVFPQAEVININKENYINFIFGK